MNRLFHYILVALALGFTVPAFSQTSVRPGSQTVTYTLASVNQPLYPAWYAIIYISLAIVVIFMIGVIVTAFRKKS